MSIDTFREQSWADTDPIERLRLLDMDDSFVVFDPTVKEDVQLLAHLYATCVTELELAGSPNGANFSTVFMFSRAMVPVGFIALKRLPDQVAGIELVYVLPEYRGQGYGQALLAATQSMTNFEVEALQPISLSGMKAMKTAGITIRDIDPVELSNVNYKTRKYRSRAIRNLPCKHRSRGKACKGCTYKYYYASMLTAIPILAHTFA